MANKKGRVENLRPPASTEEARERGRKGGLKSQEVQKKRKQAKECMNMLLSLDVNGQKNRSFLSNLGIKDEDQQNIMLLMARMYVKAAATGDAGAISKILEIVGDYDISTVEKQSPTININVQAASDNDISDL